ncbi:MAG: 2-hydroxyacyl-CoA dehydratase, partial [Candidatus Korarchaeota archaeon]|nr:2-hydroxyacyl-CoA dehydratase [Candidatus Korarchaeota archaeon]
NTPHSTTENSVRFFYEELERFRKWITQNFETEITKEKLRYAIEIFNENRRLLKQVYNLRRCHPPLISGSETLEIVLSSMMVPKDEHNRLLHGLLAEIENRKVPEKECVRLLVSGSAMGSSKLLRLVEGVRGCVVADDICTG